MKQWKEELADALVGMATFAKIVPLKDIAAQHDINHINRSDVMDIVNALKKRLPDYRPMQLMNTPNDSLFQSLCFVQNDVAFDDGSEFVV